MRSRLLFLSALLGLASMAASCSPASSAAVPEASPISEGPEPTPASSTTEEWPSAREAVALAYAALTAEWKPGAMLAFVGRYSEYCSAGCSPYLVEEDAGIGSDGRQAHWVVILSEETTSFGSQVFYVEDGEARLVAPDVATIRPAELFALEGWVDSTEIEFRSSQPVGLELRTNEVFGGVDADLEAHPLLWLAETSYARYDIYDAMTGQFIKSR